MALEAVVFSQHPFSYSKGFSLLGAEEQSHWSLELESGFIDGDAGGAGIKISSWNVKHSPPEMFAGAGGFNEETALAEVDGGTRKKRRRSKSCKNKEATESQRMSHIAVERNRRRQMNDYLAELRSLMPPNYIQRGDQASIIGGAINYVKELEHLIQILESHKQSHAGGSGKQSSSFSGFFTFPQHSATAAGVNSGSSVKEVTTSQQQNAEAADLEVTMVESHASLKVLTKRRPRQLMKMMIGLQSLRLTTLHLNVSTIDQMALYSFSLKVEEDSELDSVEKIAEAVHQMMEKIEEETIF